MLGYGNGIIGLIALILAIWVIYDVVSVQKKMDSGMKILWVVLAIILPIIGPVLYYFLGKK